MCGRYAASANQAQLVETFEPDLVVEPASPAPWTTARYNIAPTDPVAAVLTRIDKESAQPTRRLTALRWGLVPSWSKQVAGKPLINARLETVDVKPSFRKAFASRRCVLPADGYYEWYPLRHADGSPVLGQGNRPVKQPFYLTPNTTGAAPMVMAGIYEFWRNPTLPSDDPDAWLVSSAIITTTATDDLGHIHDRMPVQIKPEQLEAWLDPELTDAAAARSLLHLPEPGELSAHAVRPLVNSVTNDGPELIEALADEVNHEGLR